MQSNNRFLDDLARLATGAAGAATSLRGEMEASFRAFVDRQLASMDLVTREEFEVVQDMARKAREENEALKARLEKLEGGKTTAAASTAAKKTPRKPSTRKRATGRAPAKKPAKPASPDKD